MSRAFSEITRFYGFDLDQILDLTPFQLKEYQKNIFEIRDDEKSWLAQIYRVANHGNKDQFKRFTE